MNDETCLQLSILYSSNLRDRQTNMYQSITVVTREYDKPD